MNTTKWCACAALTAALGCASTPRMQPSPTPLFESNVRTDEVDDGPVETGRPELNTAPVPPKARLSDAADPGQPTSVATEPRSSARADETPPPAGTQGGQQERQRICDDLRRGVRMEVEETDDGARLWLRPQSRADAQRLRKTADQLAATTAADTNTTASAAPCALYQLLAAGADLRTHVVDDAIRIDVRALDRTRRGEVRDELRRFAASPR